MDNNIPLSINGINQGFSGKSVLRNVSLELKPGTVTGLLGLNGAGKTTLIQIALGLLPQKMGEVAIFGAPVWDAPPTVRQRIGYVPQVFDGFGWMNVKDCLDYVGAFYPRWDSDWLSRLCIEWDMNQEARVATLSEGQKQKLSILLALGHHPDLLVLDEPVASLDPAARRAFIRELVQLNADEGQTVLFSTHITSDIERAAADVGILHKGELWFHGAIDELKETVVRLQLTSATSLPQTLNWPGVISYKPDGRHGIVCLREWSEGSLEAFIKMMKVQATVSPMNLEEVFLEVTA